MKTQTDKNNAIPPSGITGIILNNEEKSSKDLKSIVFSLSDPKILILKSGFIFNASILNNRLYIGILPYFIEGERTHHYDISLPLQGKCLLYGFINANKTLDLFFKPARDTYNGCFLPGIADIFLDNYIRLARFLIENGFERHFTFDLGTQNLFEETKLFALVPATVEDLALQVAPFDLR